MSPSNPTKYSYYDSKFAECFEISATKADIDGMENSSSSKSATKAKVDDMEDFFQSPKFGNCDPKTCANASPRCLYKKNECNTVQPKERRNAVGQIELAAQIAASTEIPAVKAQQKAKARKSPVYKWVEKVDKWNQEM
ncbi:MAG: hypothetical protein Q9166_004150 [cf. Caloplaca sp. 2 TL-2023]